MLSKDSSEALKMEIILFIVFGAVGVGFLLILLLAVAEKKQKQSTPNPQEKTLDQTQFEKACIQILETMKLDLEEFHRTADNQLDILAKNQAPFVGGTYLVQCLYVPGDFIINAPKILELSNTIVQDRLSKGIFMTTGQFTPDLMSISELAPIEFIDGEKFRTLVKEHAPDYWVILS